MILLTKDTTNKFVVSLLELSVLDDPIWLFVFRSKQGKKNYAVIIASTTEYADGRELFTLIEPTNLALGNYGQYEYSIYEQTSLTNIDPLLATNLLEVGIMILENPAQTNTTNSNVPTDSQIHDPRA